MPRLIFLLSGIVALAAAIVLGARQRARPRAQGFREPTNRPGPY
jgi:hypothetical protein